MIEQHQSVAADDDASPSSYDYIFGFGSIMNTSTHATWKTTSSTTTTTDMQSSGSLPGVIATISKEFGYKRQWSFRSSTGFTALGVEQVVVANEEEGGGGGKCCEINGVIFQVPTCDIPDFDRREVGYTKIRIPLEYITIQNDDASKATSNISEATAAATEVAASNQQQSYRQQANFTFTSNDNIWLYVPLPGHIHYADENHPLLQSYVDTVLQGCLEWGGPTMAEQFIVTTGGWSEYFLNDTPSSRRPWLYRKEYNTIDELLKRYEEKTYYGERRHPEEFASAFSQRFRGTWSIPRRNPNFTGRDVQLDTLRSKLLNQDRGKQRVVVRVEVAGMGGVGKTQLVTEYCYRNFPSQYGLVIWLNAETADTLVADYRSLLSDMAVDVVGDAVVAATATAVGIHGGGGGGGGGVTASAATSSADNSTGDTMNKSTDEIVSEVKTRLFRSRVPWLLVFDNLEDHNLLNEFVPRGAGIRGHIIVTTRHVETEAVDSHGTLILGCFDISESLELLRRSAGSQNIEGAANTQAARELCKAMGNLPLALGMAAAYMRRCDVQCLEYLDRYIASEKTGQTLFGKVENYSLSVASSVSLSLGEIEKESPTTCQVLQLLSFLGPDLITKWLIRNLLSSKKSLDLKQLSEREESSSKRGMLRFASNRSALICGFALAGGTILLLPSFDGRRLGLCAGLAVASMLAFSSTAMDCGVTEANKELDIKRSASVSNAISAYEYEESDIAWDLLKSFCLLSVKEGKGSVHRLLQQSMRSCQSDDESRCHLVICIDALRSLWTFKTETVESFKEVLQILEHVKCAVSHALEIELDTVNILKAAQMSMEAGVFSAMALNAFVEAQNSLHIALSLLEKAETKRNCPSQRLKAKVLHELGPIYRYQGRYTESERSLQQSLEITQPLSRKDTTVRQAVADTLHELGVLEVKKHNLDSAAQFLQRSLDLRQSLTDTESDTVNAKCAATLHQLAATYVARKPPSLEQAKALLQDALKLCRQIGQRAATLKQLARVTIRQGDLNQAEIYLEQALELYLELFGDNKMHINIASVKFQQGALALQREQWDDAWSHFSECLRIRRHVYAYAKQIGAIGTETTLTPKRKSVADTNPIHLEVSVVLHELGIVGFSQRRFSQSYQMLLEERAILENLSETTSHSNRIYQARLTCLTWLRKCAKELDREDEAEKFTNERTAMKKEQAGLKKKETHLVSKSISLQHKVIDCRLLARQFALDKNGQNLVGKEKLLNVLDELKEEIKLAPPESMARAATQFHDTLMLWIDEPVSKRRQPILQACDSLRDILRAHGVQVVDSVSRKKR